MTDDSSRLRRWLQRIGEDEKGCYRKPSNGYVHTWLGKDVTEAVVNTIHVWHTGKTDRIGWSLGGSQRGGGDNGVRAGLPSGKI